MEEEVWKHLSSIGYSNYEISNIGNLRNRMSERKFNPNPTKAGYIRVSLKNDKGKITSNYLHILVATIFIPNPDNLKIVDHINREKLDNNYKNLRWVTQKQNMNNKTSSFDVKGICIYQLDINENILKKWNSIKSAAINFNVRPKDIKNALIKRELCSSFSWRLCDEIDIIENEIWKEFPSNREYFVSNLGRIKPPNNYITKGSDKGEYMRLGIFIEGIRMMKGVHCVVAETFLIKIKDKTIVNHKDGDKKNNRIDNLEYVNNQENSIHANINKLIKKRTVSVTQFDLDNNIIEKFNSIVSATQKTGISASCIIQSCKHNRITQKKYRWNYSEENY